MASQNDIGFKTFQASPAVSQFIAVEVQSDGTITPASAGSRGVGVTQSNVPAAAYLSVKLWSAPGTFMLQVTGTAISPGNQYAITSGGFVTVTGTGCVTPQVQAFGSAVASNGIVADFMII